MISETASFYNALLTHYLSQRHEALAVLKLYMTKPSAVGEHSDLLEDMKKWTSKLADAEEALEVLTKYFKMDEVSKGEEKDE